MWPILLLSLVTGAVVLERLAFLLLEHSRRQPGTVEALLGLVEKGRLDEAATQAQTTSDPLARVLAYGLEHRDVSLSNALLQAAGRELDRYNRGLVVLDTAVTLGPLLGLLGTVIGMIRAFGIVGGADLAGKTSAITGGIAESLIAVTFGLGVAIVAIIPLNILTARMETIRRRLEDATNHLELLVVKARSGG
ncbi:MAG: MotA/TolQ/ExbB proton channel family protein [Candidatus Methylacidiphilales bacterium]|nr:MotA/TolQ/ExbB proton channel family protein [Candidatus Methylacidiphilales bacterium]